LEINPQKVFIGTSEGMSRDRTSTLTVPDV